MITEREHKEIQDVAMARAAVSIMERIDFPSDELRGEWREITEKARSLALRAWDNTDRLVSGDS